MTNGAGDADYGKVGTGYAVRRRPDPRIAERIHAALGEAATVLNVGAGAGSYEPRDCRVLAVEPAAAMAILTVHHWPDLASGRWDEQYGALRRQREFEGAVRLLVAGRPTLEAARSMRPRRMTCVKGGAWPSESLYGGPGSSGRW